MAMEEITNTFCEWRKRIDLNGSRFAESNLSLNESCHEGRGRKWVEQ